MADEADAAIGAILTIDPLYRPDPSEASPAVRAAFTAARRRMLPALVRGLYAEARDAFDRRAFRDAATKFEKAQRAIEDPDARGIAALADMGVLTSGFLELSRAALGQSLAERAADAPSEPVMVRQEMPRWTFALASAFYEPNLRAVVELEIDARGDVVSAEVLQSTHPQYDAVLAKAALAWKYEPARRNGQPVEDASAGGRGAEAEMTSLPGTGRG